MDPSQMNPFAVLTFIVAPAILTNASSVMALGTSNRFARTIDRIRALNALMVKPPEESEAEAALRRRQLATAARRVLYQLRALTAFYISLGAFALASFAPLLGAIAVVAHAEPIHYVALSIALVAGVIGVGGLITGAAMLVWESRLALAILRDEAQLVRETVLKAGATPPDLPPPP